MPDLLSTKLFIPPLRPGLVTRPRLLEKMQAALNHNLTLISAPAGFGKTTLLSDWIHSAMPPIPAAWLSLDDADNDPVTFWDYVVTALRMVHPKAGETALSLLHSSPPVPIQSTLTALINDLAGISHDFILVLDDYHFIQSPPIQEGIAFLLEHLPPKMHLVIASRMDPPFSLARLRGKGTLLEIGADDLRFTDGEAAGLISELDAPGLSGEDVEALNKRAEGWVAGLKMAMFSLKGEKDIPRFIEKFTGSQRYIMDYLLEEVLQKQSPEIQDFLLKASVLERLSPALCDAVTAGTDGRKMLHTLEKSGLFLVQLDESQEWYRFHHLFADLLRHQLELKFAAPGVKEAHCRASIWYEKNGFPDDAIHHSTTAQDWDRVIHLISANSMAKILRSEQLTIVGWLQAIPEEVLRCYHEMYLFYGLLVVDRGHIEIAERCLRYLTPVTGNDPVLSARLAVLQFFIARARGDLGQAIELGNKALSLLPPEERWRSTVSMYVGIIQWGMGNLPEAEQAFQETYNAALGAKLTGLVAISLGYLGFIAFWRGQVWQGLDTLKQSIVFDDRSAAAAFPLGELGIIHYELNDLETAAVYFEQALKSCCMDQFSEITEFVNVNLARLRMAQGDLVNAQRLMEESDHYVHQVDASRLSRIGNAAWHFYLALLDNDDAALLGWGRMVQANVAILPFYVRHIPVRLLIAQGKKTEAAAQLVSLVEQAAQNKWWFSLLTLRVYQSLAAPSDREALTFLTEALRMAKTEGYVRTFVDEAKLLTPLLKQVVTQGTESEYACKLLDIIETEERQRKARTRRASLPVNAEILSQRELEVLKLLADEVPNEQIARKLSVSLSTVKTHVHHILEKLAVKDRSQAVFRARELKLI